MIVRIIVLTVFLLLSLFAVIFVIATIVDLGNHRSSYYRHHDDFRGRLFSSQCYSPLGHARAAATVDRAGSTAHGEIPLSWMTPPRTAAAASDMCGFAGGFQSTVRGTGASLGIGMGFGCVSCVGISTI